MEVENEVMPSSPERIKESAGFSELQLDRQHWYEICQAARGNEVP